MKKILLIAGTRPNFVKLAPLYHQLKKEEALFDLSICHTGQHFDFNMSDIFWQSLQLPTPDFQLNIKGNSVADTIGKSIIGINEVVQQHTFDLLIVFGDVNATVAGAIVGAQSKIPVMHIEAGLRSFDRTMPEEVNRVITDHVSNYLMVSEPSGVINLQNEGFEGDKIIFVGNIMIECLLNSKHHWEAITLTSDLDTFYQQKPIVATFHRPENVDERKNLEHIVDILFTLSFTQPVVFPIHPRTKSRMMQFGLLKQFENNKNILISEPLGYFEFLKLVSNAKLVITDSGGIQEETSYLNIPCVTFRKNTERPITITIGTNLLLDISEVDYNALIYQHIKKINSRTPLSIPLWDNNVSHRIVEFIKKALEND